MIILGVDVGKKGGLVVLDGDKVVDHAPMPIGADGWPCADAIASLVIRNKVEAVALEAVVGKSQAGGWKYRVGYGVLVGIFKSLDVELWIVQPKDWQKEISAGKFEKVHGRDFATSKGFDVPNKASHPRSTFHDGISDAFCIAWYLKECFGDEL